MDAEEVRYDQKADVLYIWSTNPEDVDDIISEETGEEILIEKDADTGDVIGVIILHFSKREDAIEGIDLSRAELSPA